jgi:hypothetical protein
MKTLIAVTSSLTLSTVQQADGPAGDVAELHLDGVEPRP